MCVLHVRMYGNFHVSPQLHNSHVRLLSVAIDTLEASCLVDAQDREHGYAQ
jgi:hypothetical protein